MIEYKYLAKNKDGEVVNGAVEADNTSSAAKVLMTRNLYPITIEEVDKSSFYVPFINGIRLKDKAFLVRQLATAVNAGLPISQALEMISQQMNQKKLKSILTQVTRDVEGGMQLSTSFSRFPELFSAIDVTLIAAGETSGTLDKILVRIADSIENDYRIGAKVRGALVYPGFIFAVVIAVIFMMSYYVMPQMEGLYKSFNAQLPLITRIVVGFSHGITTGGPFILLLLVGLIVGLRVYINKTEEGRKIWDKIKLSTPIIGPFLKKVYVARFARTLTGLVASGVALVQALNIVSKAIGNVVYSEAILDAAQKVKSGVPLSTPLREQQKEFPLVVSQLIKVGEQTGELDNMLAKVADYYEEEIDNFVKSISSIIEPVLIVTLAVIVGVVMIAIMLPIYRIGKIL